MNSNKINTHVDTKFALAFIFSALLSILICGLTFFFLFDDVQTKPQIFHDIIIENVAKSRTNKTGELQLFYAVLVLGILLFILFYQIACRFLRLDKSTTFTKELPLFVKLSFLLVLPNLIRFIVYGDIHNGLLGLTVITVIYYFVWKDSIIDILTFHLFAYYGLVSLLTVLCQLFSLPSISTNTLYIMTLLSSTVFILLCRILKNSKLLKNGILLLQLTFPFMLFIYFVDNYLYRGTLIEIPYAKGYTFFFAILCILCFALLIRHIFSYFYMDANNRNRDFANQEGSATLSLDSIICKATPIILFIYNSFSAAPMYAQPDQHHHGEQMIPWQQVFTLSQTLYEEYSPVSGLFPFFSGGIQNLLLNGTVSDYSPAISISMVLFCIITMLLITEHVGTAYGVLFAIFFSLPCYNRQYFMLPVLLLLFLPKLMEKKNLWLKCWLLSCFVAGLYYPLYGAALVMGTLPLLIYQLMTFIKSGQLKPMIRKPGFYIGWIICVTPVIFSVPLLLKMLMHTLTYSSQTVLADGISLWGQSVPDTFMTYMSNQTIRQYCYFGLRFLLPAIGVWLFVYLLYHVLTFYFSRKKKKFSQNIAYVFLFLCAGAITLLISYTYTLVRADTGMILSRTSYILTAIAGIFLPIILIQYSRQLISPKIRMLIISFCLSLPLMLYHKTSDMKRPDMWIYPNGESALFLDDASKIYSYYEVPANFVRSHDSGLSKEQIDTLGPGFMVDDQLHYLTDYERVIKLCESVKSDMTYLGMDGQGFYYYTNAKACGTGFIQAAKGYDAQNALLEIIRQKRPVVFTIDAQSNYYIYFYLLTNDYVYVQADGVLYPKELYQMLYGQTTDDYRETCTGLDLGLTPASFGKSKESLLELMTPMSDNSCDYGYGTFKGSEYDFLEVTLTDAQIAAYQSLTVSFDFSSATEETGRTSCHVLCTINGNTLLIPMGMNPCWLLSDIQNIRFEATDVNGQTTHLDTKDLDFKLYSIRK